MSKISSSHYYDFNLNIIFRFPDPKNITLDNRIIKISHVDQKMKENKNLHFQGRPFWKNPRWPPSGVDSSGHPFYNWSLWPTLTTKKFGFLVRHVNILTLRPLADKNAKYAIKNTLFHNVSINIESVTSIWIFCSIRRFPNFFSKLVINVADFIYCGS